MKVMFMLECSICFYIKKLKTNTYFNRKAETF
jgi:hypothetical protein